MRTRVGIYTMIFALLLTSVFALNCTDPACVGEVEDATTTPLITCEVTINGDEVFTDRTNRLSVEAGERLSIKVRMTSGAEIEDVQMDAFISGYEYNDFNPIHDSTHVFDVEPNVTYSKTMVLDLPDNLERDRYTLRILVSGRSGASFERRYNLQVDVPRHNVVIRDVILDPSTEVVSGRALLANVRVKNMGDRDEEGVKVTVSIPALDLEASEYIDELESDESTTSEDLYLRIPRCAPEGRYVVRATVRYDENYEVATSETSIQIAQDETCELNNGEGNGETEQPADKTVITVPGKQDVVQGAGGSAYPIMISNTGANSRSYRISISGVDAWGTYRIDPSNLVVVGARRTETVYVYVSANADAQPGEKMFMATVDADGEVKQIPLTANVVEGQDQPAVTTDWQKIQKGLEVGLIVLVVLLVILGLIVGFNKLKGGDGKEPEEVSGQTYY